jgi:BASS family bile acid:Na+ symporter
LTADAWDIAKPLLFFLLVPLVIGMAIRSASALLASRLQPFVRNATKLATGIMLALVVIIYGKGFIGTIGTYAIGAQILFFTAATVAAYGLGFGLPQDQRSVLTLGICTRNPGAAFAPLLAVQGTDERAIIMVALCLPMQIFFSFIVARWFRSRAEKSSRRTTSECAQY